MGDLQVSALADRIRLIFIQGAQCHEEQSRVQAPLFTATGLADHMDHGLTAPYLSYIHPSGLREALIAMSRPLSYRAKGQEALITQPPNIGSRVNVIISPLNASKAELGSRFRNGLAYPVHGYDDDFVGVLEIFKNFFEREDRKGDGLLVIADSRERLHQARFQETKRLTANKFKLNDSRKNIVIAVEDLSDEDFIRALVKFLRKITR